MDSKDFRSDTGRAVNPNKRIAVNSSNTNNYSPSTEWWIYEDEAGALDSVKQMVALLAGSNLLSRIQRYRIESRLYGIADYFANLARSYSPNWNNQQVLPDRLSFNVVQSNIDTLVSKVSRLKPRVRYLTNAGDYKAVKAAKKLGYFSDGIFEENDIYSAARLVIRDALVFGDGFFHFYERNKRVAIERVIPYEIMCDELECVGGGKPTHFYRTKLVSRKALMAEYPQLAEKIAASQQLFTINLHVTSPATDQIEVLEAWRIGTGDEREDGRHLLAVPDCVLQYGPWTAAAFPFSRISWTLPFSGYWSQSLSEQLKSTQLEINKLLAVQQRSYHLAGSFKILVQNGSQIPVESFNNNVGTIIKYTGAKPEYITPPVLPPEFYANLNTLIERSYRISGVSQLSAASQKPAGLNSGVALREFNDIESARFLEFSQDIEQFFVDSARCCMTLAGEIAKKNSGHYPISTRGAKSITLLDLKEIRLKENDYTISVFPASSLPQEPSGRLEAIDDLVRRGLIDPVEQRELLNFPDIEASNQLSTSQDEYLKEIFERMLEEGEYTPPDPLDNLQLARKLCVQFYALGKKLGESEEKLELFRQFVRDLAALEAPEPVVPQLPQPALGAQISPAETQQLALPAATAPLPMAAEAIAAGTPPVGIA